MMRDEQEHPIDQPIREVQVYNDADNEPRFYRIGRIGVTRIEACTKSGMHANIPYIRVWKDDVCEAEFCQHNIIGVYFDPPEVEEAPPFRTFDKFLCPDEGLATHDFLTCIHCGPI